MSCGLASSWCFQPKALQCWTLADLQWQVGKFKVLNLLGRGYRFATACSGQICFAIKTCSWNPVQIGVAGQPLASESALVAFNPKA